MAEQQNGGGGSSHTESIRRPYFGRQLRALRESYGERVYGSGGEIPASHMVLSAAELVECMQKKGLKISTSTYNEIEQGFNIPREAASFLDAASSCLHLSPSDRQDLADRMAYDILWARLRERADDVFPPKRHWPPRED